MYCRVDMYLYLYNLPLFYEICRALYIHTRGLNPKLYMRVLGTLLDVIVNYTYAAGILICQTL